MATLISGETTSLGSLSKKNQEFKVLNIHVLDLDEYIPIIFIKDT